MAYSIVPSGRWKEILEIADEKEQGIAATEYVNSLEKEIVKLKIELDNVRAFQEIDIVNNIMNKEPFKRWLKNHDDMIYDRERQNWSGVK